MCPEVIVERALPLGRGAGLCVGRRTMLTRTVTAAGYHQKGARALRACGLESPAMKRHCRLVLLTTLTGLLFAATPLPKFDPLPLPLSDNAVASVKSRGALLLFSMMGIGPKKTWDAISNSAFSLDPETGKWAEVHAVPGTAGRLAAAAVGAREHIFLFGGYVVDAQGGETTLSDLNVYEPLTDRWFRGEDMPIPVDDAVAGVYRDRYIYLVGGWSKTDTVRAVQV